LGRERTFSLADATVTGDDEKADTGMIGAGWFLSVCVDALTYILRPVTIVTIAYVFLVLCFYQSEDWGGTAPSSG